MDFYTMEQFEIIGDAMEEVAEWDEFEADYEEWKAEFGID